VTLLDLPLAGTNPYERRSLGMRVTTLPIT
jgi:hypothetical protein